MNKNSKEFLSPIPRCAIVLLTCLVVTAGEGHAPALAQTNEHLNTKPSTLVRVPLLASRFVPVSFHPTASSYTCTNIDNGITDEFTKAWMISCAGINDREGVVLIFRMEGGSYTAKLQRRTNEYKQSTFTWNPAAVAIVHTHPNSCDPCPGEQDKRVADKYQVPIFTITIHGMYVYDPAIKKTSKVLNALEWLKPVNQCRWAQEIGRGVDSSVASGLRMVN